MKKLILVVMICLMLQFVALGQSSTDLNEGKLRDVTLGFKSAGGATIPPSDVTEVPSWSSSNTGICEIQVAADGKSGKIIYVGVGSATVTITVGTVSHTIDITCFPRSIATIEATISPETDIPTP